MVAKNIARLGRLLPESFRVNLDRRLASTRMAFTAEEFAGLSLLLSLFLSLLAAVAAAALFLSPALLLLFPALFPTLFLTLVWAVPYQKAKKRAAELERELPDALRHMASVLRAGVGVEEALTEISKSKYGALSEEFGRVVAEVKKGRSLVNALLAFGKRSFSPLCERTSKLITEGVERGAGLADVLEAVATDALEVRAIQRERVAVTTQQVLFLMVVSVMAAPFVIGLALSITSMGGGPGTKGNVTAQLTLPVTIYTAVQAFICGVAVGIIRYGSASRGMRYSALFIPVAVLIVRASGLALKFIAPSF
jgi:flagellar protein FlaJ